MPVTAKLSREFYERLGDVVVNELVGLLNLADATYRLELREQNELNFARFEAKLEQRLAELRGELGERFARLEAAFDEKLDKKLEAKLTEKLKPFVTKEELEKSLRDQTGLFFGAWGILLAAIIALWFR